MSYDVLIRHDHDLPLSAMIAKKTWVEHNHDPMKLNSIYLFVLKTQIPFWAGDGPFSF